MASSRKLPTEVQQKIDEGPAGNKEYAKQKKRNLQHFQTYLREIEKVVEPLDELVKDGERFENLVKNYFFGIEVPENEKNKKTGKLTKTGKMTLPTMGYAKNIKASLFMVFKTEFKVNLADQVVFPNHSEWWGKYMAFLKKGGKGTVQHKPRLHHKFNEQCMVIAYHCLKALQNRGNPELLRKHQKYIPASLMNKPHVIIQKYKILQIIMFGIRRGKEGIAELRVGSFKKEEDEVWGHKSWVKQVNEASKNHQDDEESLENCGQIPYLDMLRISDEDGEDLVFNPGEFFEEVSQFYDPETDEDDRLFVRANEAIGFNVWDPSNKVLFHRKSPLGKHKIGEVVSDFCQILDLDHRTNHSVRGDCIKTLRILGYSNEQICKLTGHKDPRSLLSYDPDLDPLQKLDMMAAVAQGGAGQRGEAISLPSVEIRKRHQVATTGNKFNSPSDMLRGSGCKRQKAGVEVESNLVDIPSPECSSTVASPAKPSSPVATKSVSSIASPPPTVMQPVLPLAQHVMPSHCSDSGKFSEGALREEEFCTTRTDYQYKVTQQQPQYSNFCSTSPPQQAAPVHHPRPLPHGQVQGGGHGGVAPSTYHPSHVLPQLNIVPSMQQSFPSQQPMQTSMFNTSQPGMVTSTCSFQSPAPPSRDEYNNHRLNMLESSFLLSQRTSLLESKVSSRCNFDLALPSLEEYHRLPMEPVRARLSPKPLPRGHEFGDGEGEDVCYCGLVPVIHEVKAPGSDFGRKFLSCLQKEENQCSFLKWIKKETKKPEVVDIHCNCGKVSAVRTVVKNGPNYGRMYYSCAMEERCSFFWFVDPDLHYKDRQKSTNSS